MADQVFKKSSQQQSGTQSQSDSELETKQSQISSVEVDDILDEIDTVLESNAEEFVQRFVQKGGQ